MIYLELDDLIHIAQRTLGGVEVRDVGLLESALGRARASAFGEDAYPTVHEKAAALVHSLARNHALVDGNKRLALAATVAFLGLNGQRLTLDNDGAYDLVVDVVAANLADVLAISEALVHGTEDWPAAT